MQVFDPTRATDREGRWLLRSGYLDPDGDIYVAVTSKRAPEGTLGKDLEPQHLEVTDMCGEDDEITLDVAQIKELLEWPPNG